MRTNETTRTATNYATPLLHEKQSSNKDIVNFNFELILHYYVIYGICVSTLLQTTL